MTKTRHWRILIVGAGGNAAVHAEGLLRHPDRVTLSAIVEPDEGRRSAFAGRYDVTHAHESVPEVLGDHGLQIDAAIVSTPTHVRMEVCRPLFEAGIPVLVEKPLSDNLADAIALTVEAAKHNCPLQPTRTSVTIILTRKRAKSSARASSDGRSTSYNTPCVTAK